MEPEPIAVERRGGLRPSKIASWVIFVGVAVVCVYALAQADEESPTDLRRAAKSCWRWSETTTTTAGTTTPDTSAGATPTKVTCPAGITTCAMLRTTGTAEVGGQTIEMNMNMGNCAEDNEDTGQKFDCGLMKTSLEKSMATNEVPIKLSNWACGVCDSDDCNVKGGKVPSAQTPPPPPSVPPPPPVDNSAMGKATSRVKAETDYEKRSNVKYYIGKAVQKYEEPTCDNDGTDDDEGLQPCLSVVGQAFAIMFLAILMIMCVGIQLLFGQRKPLPKPE